MVIYTVKSGDSIYEIARKFGVSPERLAKENGLSDPEQLVVGQALVIILNETKHTVQAGENLYNISQTYDITVFDILSENPSIQNPSLIQPGQVLNIPVAKNNLGDITVNGYAFPSITEETLNKTLHSLTYLTLFSYQVSSDGSLSPLVKDDFLVEKSRSQGVAPLMAVTNIGNQGGFNSEIAHSVLNDSDAQNRLLQNILNILQTKTYSGVNLDLEYIFPQDKEAYNSFLQRVTEALQPMGYIVTTALAPKLNGEQIGLLYQAHDYAAHGRLADQVILMTYEWGYTMGPPMAVAPIDQVERVIRYGVSVIPPQKILMGIPNYGYDWILPYQAGRPASTISNTDAVKLAWKVGAEIQFDEKSQSPFFRYFDNQGQEHIVWFEDARSIDAKLQLAHKYGLGGVSYWTVNRFFPQNWTVLDSLYTVNKVPLP